MSYIIAVDKRMAAIPRFFAGFRDAKGSDRWVFDRRDATRFSSVAHAHAQVLEFGDLIEDHCVDIVPAPIVLGGAA